MSDPSFAPPDRPNFVAPIIIAVVALAIVAAAVFYFNPHDTAALSLSHTTVNPIRTNFRNESTIVNATPVGQDDLYILTTLRIDNHLRLPITINTMSAVLVTADDQQSTTSAVNQTDIPVVFAAFPQLRPLSAPPLLRETTIEPAQFAEGQIILHFPVTKAVWDARKSAAVTVDLYHQSPQTIKIP